VTPPRGAGRGKPKSPRGGSAKPPRGAKPATGRGGAKAGTGGKPGTGKPAARGAKPASRGAKPPSRGSRAGARTARVLPQRTADDGAVVSRTTGPKRGLGGEQVEGRQAVRELLMAGRRRTREVWMLADQEPAEILEDIVALASAERVTLREVGRAKFFAQARCEAPQGVLAMAGPLEEVDLDDLAATRSGSPPPFLVAVDGVTDPGNLGALLRSAECAGATGVVLPRHRAVHITPTVTKSAAGAVEHLDCAVVGGLPAALARLRELGVWVVGLDGDGEGELWSMPAADGPIALVLGAEGSGLSRLVRQRCDAVVRIPLGGSLTSLNVAAAGALACFEVARARA
jgi:23S rRNA (guanosine2251-2'-O)-methyltransferase